MVFGIVVALDFREGHKNKYQSLIAGTVLALLSLIIIVITGANLINTYVKTKIGVLEMSSYFVTIKIESKSEEADKKLKKRLYII